MNKIVLDGFLVGEGEPTFVIAAQQLRDMVDGVREMEKMLGTGRLGCSEAERPALVFRRPS